MKKPNAFFLLMLISLSAYTQVNIAIGKDATASNTHSSTNVKSIIDGTVSTAWNSGAFAPQWIIIDLQKKYDISKFILIPCQTPAGSTTHEILISSDLITWQSVDVFTIYSSDKTSIIRSFSSTLKNVKGIKILTSVSPSWVAWYDIEVYGDISSSQN